MKHAVASNLARFLTENDFLSGLQHGFQEKGLCKRHLTELVEDLGKQLIVGHQINLVLLDFSNAFNKINTSPADMLSFQNEYSETLE